MSETDINAIRARIQDHIKWLMDHLDDELDHARLAGVRDALLLVVSASQREPGDPVYRDETPTGPGPVLAGPCPVDGTRWSALDVGSCPTCGTSLAVAPDRPGETP